MNKLLAFFVLVLLGACRSQSAQSSASIAPSPSGASPAPEPTGGTEVAAALESGQAEAIFAGGCFWCVETAFEGQDGVVSVVSGYTGGGEAHPTYEQVSSGSTGHLESVRVVYDPSRISYERLLEIFVHNIDPTQADGQFCDHGSQYRSAIFVRADAERRAALDRLARASAELGRSIATEVRDASPFWVAEAYHQDYYRTHPARYSSYRAACGRDDRLRALWGERAGQAAH